MTNAENLLSALWGTKGDAVNQITIIKDGKAKNHIVSSIGDAVSKAESFDIQGYDVYHACAAFQNGDSRTSSNAIGAYSVFLDIDCGAEKAVNGKGYVSKKAAMQALAVFLQATVLPAPTHIVDSGNGLHVYFCFNRLIPKDQWQALTRQLKALCKHHGFLADETRTADIASILRLPGTHNYKDKLNPKLVKLKHTSSPIDISFFVSVIEDAYKKIYSSGINTLPAAASLFPLEQLGARATIKPFEYSNENRVKLLEASRAAYPDGILDFENFKSLGLALASVVSIDRWPEQVAKDIFDDVCSKPESANREKNDELWAGFIKSTSEKHKRGESVISVGSIFHQAKDNGWHSQSIEQNPTGVDDFALITIGSKVGIMDLNQASKSSTTNPLCVYSITDGKLLLKRKITEQNPSANADKIVNQWIYSPYTKAFMGVEFNPSRTTHGYFNLWRGMSVMPLEGDCNLIISFIRDVICSGSSTHFDYLWGWLAHMIQKPEEKPGVSITLLGGQGIGKGMFAAKLVGALYADHFLHLQSDRALTGDFNDSLESSYIVFADEAFFSGDRKAANILKAVETETRIHINPKYQPSRQIESYHRIISASNNDHATYVEADDRRKFILRVSEQRKHDRAYWENLNAQINNGGLEAFAFELLNSDISRFQVRDKPDTGELLKQKLASLEAIPQWWADRLMEGAQLSSSTSWSEWVSTSLLHEDFVKTARANNSRNRVPSIREFVDKLKTFCPDMQPSQHGQANSRKRGFTFPDLNRARELFEIKLGGKLPW